MRISIGILFFVSLIVPAVGLGPPERARAQALSGDRWTAGFTGNGDAYAGAPLVIQDRLMHRTVLVGRADPYVRPIWSLDHVRLLYVRVRAVPEFPSARWSLFRYNRLTGQSRLLASRLGMNLSPLGWLGGRPLYALARETQTGIYRVVGSRSRYISFLFTQPLTGPSLSPGARFIAYVTPADCTWCTISIFDMRSLQSWFGPVGVPSKDTVAWTRNGGTLVTIVRGALTAIDTRSHAIRFYRTPIGLPQIWTHPMHATIDGSSLRLIDTVTEQIFMGSRQSGS